MRLCAISVDLDEVQHYHQIHGLGPADPASAALVYERALDRLDDLARRHRIPLTFFVIGESVAAPAKAERLKRLSELGHELANHTYRHVYGLTRLDREAMRDEVEKGIDALEREVGVRPTGFRAPGYTVSDDLFDVLASAGVTYDSSVFPCPAYYAAKVTAIVAIALSGRRSRSVIDTPYMLASPRRPYRIGRPYWRSGSGLLELPIQVTRGPRLPYIGTTLTMAGPTGARWLTRAVSGEPLVNLELHAIDVLDAADGLEGMRAYQPDVRVPHVRKLDALDAAIATLRAAGYAFVRLDEAARAFARGGVA